MKQKRLLKTNKEESKMENWEYKFDDDDEDGDSGDGDDNNW